MILWLVTITCSIMNHRVHVYSCPIMGLLRRVKYRGRIMITRDLIALYWTYNALIVWCHWWIRLVDNEMLNVIIKIKIQNYNNFWGPIQSINVWLEALQKYNLVKKKGIQSIRMSSNNAWNVMHKINTISLWNLHHLSRCPHANIWQMSTYDVLNISTIVDDFHAIRNLSEFVSRGSSFCTISWQQF